MENEIKDNEYIRTDTGKIDKVINADYYMPQYIECEKDLIFKNNIVKHSSNIIDLTKVGDVAKILDNTSGEEHHITLEDEIQFESVKETIEDGIWTLLEIYTKEMMESISYKVTKM